MTSAPTGHPLPPGMLEGVSSHFIFDWNFAIKVARVNSFASIATILSLSAISLNIQEFAQINTFGYLSLWASIVIYIAAFAIIKFRAPSFLQQYPHFKSFNDEEHSHRWIVWLFFNAFKILRNSPKLLRESVVKDLSYSPASLSYSQDYSFSPHFSGNYFEKKCTVTVNGTSKEILGRTYEPVNNLRDIYMPFSITVDGRETKYVLPIIESDTKLEAKKKELFWIIFTESAKENPVSRYIAWLLLSSSLLLLAVFILMSLISIFP